MIVEEYMSKEKISTLNQWAFLLVPFQIGQFKLDKQSAR